LRRCGSPFELDHPLQLPDPNQDHLIPKYTEARLPRVRRDSGAAAEPGGRLVLLELPAVGMTAPHVHAWNAGNLRLRTRRRRPGALVLHCDLRGRLRDS
jgi:hypothetical protein